MRSRRKHIAEQSSRGTRARYGNRESMGHAFNVYHVGRDEKEFLSQAVKRSHLGCPVRSIGQLSNSALAAAYEQATCVIVTSTHEGFCLPVLEAQFFGTPVICSDIPVLREVAGDGALFFRLGDPSDLAHCLGLIFGNVEIRQRLVSRPNRTQRGSLGPRPPQRRKRSSKA